MPAPTRTIVDPRFPAELGRLRRTLGLSFRTLGQLAYYGKSYLHDLEHGRAQPTVEVAQHLDTVLQAGGILAAMVTDPPAVTTPDDDQRIAHILANPASLDVDTVRVLADTLAAQRRLDDSMLAAVMLPWVVPQWRTVQQLAADARGPHAPKLHEVAAEWTQFVGWLHAETRNDTEAVRVLLEASEQADAVNNGHLAAQASNFRGYLERQRGNPRGIVRHFLTAYHTPGASPLQRIGDAAQAAHGYALLGDTATAHRLLGEASDLTTAVDGQVPPGTAYWLSPTFGRMNLGLAYRALGDRRAAADNLRAGLGGLPGDQQDAEWTQEYRRALVDAAG